MSAADDQQARINDTIPTVAFVVARYVKTNDDGTVQADFGQGQIPILNAGLYSPRPGESVRVLKVNGTTVMVGPSAPRSSQGTVVATGSPNLTVDTSAGETQLPYLDSYAAPTVGDSVLIDWSLGAVLGKLTSTPTSEYVPPAPPSTIKANRTEFNAQWAGNFYVPGSRWNSDQPYAVSTGNNIGAWGYGSTVQDTIPATANIDAVWFHSAEAWNKYPSTKTTLGLHNLSTRTGNPTPTGAHGIDSGSGWRKLPKAYGEALRDGTAKGLSTGTSGEARYKALGADKWSGRLRIDWTG